MEVSKRPTTPAHPVTTVIRSLTAVFNPLVLKLAGRRALPLYAVIHHRGRRTGREYATPVVVRPAGEFMFFPLAFGPDAGWSRNLLAAGAGSVRWKGADIAISDFEVVDAPTVLGPGSPYPWLFRIAAIHVFRVRQFLRARRADASPR
jgi:deazaflavin-dependent oxidoreductase (nitroreductase family)